jgi:hypothetical protein
VYLFADSQGAWANKQLSRELAKETRRHLGVRLTGKIELKAAELGVGSRIQPNAEGGSCESGMCA